jgi:putative glutamine amidotransferase
MTPTYPLIGIPVDVKLLDNVPYHSVGEKYINAIVHGTDCHPVMLPAMADGGDLKASDSKFSLSEIVKSLDGVFLTGSYSNIHPRRYGRPEQHPLPPVDNKRDEMALDMIHVCVKVTSRCLPNATVTRK